MVVCILHHVQSIPELCIETESCLDEVKFVKSLLCSAALLLSLTTPELSPH